MFHCNNQQFNKKKSGRKGGFEKGKFNPDKDLASLEFVIPIPYFPVVIEVSAGASLTFKSVLLLLRVCPISPSVHTGLETRRAAR